MSAPRGFTAVLWHSLFVDDRSWDRLAPMISIDRRLVRMTGPLSSPTHRYTLEDCAAAALVVLDTLQVTEPVDWVGNAWGGHVGIVLAARHPERIRTLAAFNAPVQSLTSGEKWMPRLLAAIFRLIGPVQPVLSGVIAALLSPQTRAEDPAAVGYIGDCLRLADRAALVTAIRSVSLGRPDLRPLVPSITAPTLFVTSPADSLWTPAQAEAAAALMPRASTAVVAGSGHLTPFEKPDESAALLRELWSR